jgi:hypothetical protein
MDINKSDVTYDGTNIFVSDDFISTLVADAETITVVPTSRPVPVSSTNPDRDISGVPRIDETERDRLITPVDISFNQIDFYTPDGTYLPSLEVIINTLVEGAEDYVINYVKIA